MASVLRLDDRRTPGSAQARGYLACDCGSAYFVLLEEQPDGTTAPGKVTIDSTGDIDGYSGVPHCAACGRTKLP